VDYAFSSAMARPFGGQYLPLGAHSLVDERGSSHPSSMRDSLAPDRRPDIAMVIFLLTALVGIWIMISVMLFRAEKHSDIHTLGAEGSAGQAGHLG
jgi:hypothetical protein